MSRFETIGVFVGGPPCQVLYLAMGLVGTTKPRPVVSAGAHQHSEKAILRP